MRKQIESVLDAAQVDPVSPKGREFTDLVKTLEGTVTDSPTKFGREVRNTAVQLSTKLEALLDEKADDPAFAASDRVKELTSTIDLAKQQRATTYDAELEHMRKVDRVVGGALQIRR
jgi:hypothetical protein